MKFSLREAVLAGAALALVTAGTAAATEIPANQTPDAARAPANPAAAAAAAVASRPSYLHASAGDAFVQGRVTTSAGLQYVPYERTYKGLPVVGGDFVMVTDSTGKMRYASVAQNQTIGNLATTPTMPAAKAEAVARRQLTTVSDVQDSHLVVYALSGRPRLVWETTVTGTNREGPSRQTVDVDTATGAVLRAQEHVEYGVGTGALNGPNPLPLATTRFGNTFLMTDPVTRNLSCQDAATNRTFASVNDHFGNGVGTNKATGCVDALFTAQTEVKMLKQWLGRNGMDGNGGSFPIRVGLNQVNAFFDGTQVQVGHNKAGAWIGSLDVLGHEFGHSVDATTPGGPSGGNTSEFIADTFGAATEAFANERAPFDKPDFTVGEQVNLVGRGPVRIMFDPSRVGDPNCFSNAIPTAEVHKAAGPGDHMYYLMAEGTNPTDGNPPSPTCNNSTVTGIGIQKAQMIMFNAMLMKTSNSSYPRYRTLTLQAAKNLFPGSCSEFNTVKAAWDAVSVPAQAADPTCNGAR